MAKSISLPWKGNAKSPSHSPFSGCTSLCLLHSMRKTGIRLLVLSLVIIIVISLVFSRLIKSFGNQTVMKSSAANMKRDRNEYHLVRGSEESASKQSDKTTGQEQRQRLLTTECATLNTTYSRANPDLKLIVTSPKLRTLFCLTPKAACTSWIRTLLRLQGTPEAVRASLAGRTSLHISKKKHMNHMIFQPIEHFDFAVKNYYKFMFTREPLNRLVSAYRDTMFRQPGFRGLKWKIVNKYRTNPSNRTLEYSKYNITFAEFVRHIVDYSKSEATIDRHWRPQNEICRPCNVRYDFIGHHETLRDDARQVLQHIAVGRNVTEFPEFDVDNPNSTTTSAYTRQLYDTLPTSHIRFLLKFYELDYKLFGYQYPPPFLRHRVVGSL